MPHGAPASNDRTLELRRLSIPFPPAVVGPTLRDPEKTETPGLAGVSEWAVLGSNQ